MTVWYLLDALKEALEKEFQDFLLFNEQMERVPLKIFLQNLPAPITADGEDEERFPYIVISYISSEDTAINEPGLATIIFVIGVYDNDSMYQGYKDVINVQEKIRQLLLRMDVLDGRFILEFPLRCFSADDFDDSSYPFFYGGIESNWQMPAALQDLWGGDYFESN